MTANLEQLVRTSTTPWKVVRAYQIFAGKSLVEPMEQIGSVVAPNDKLAKAYARAAYADERWVELIIVPAAESQLLASGEDAA